MPIIRELSKFITCPICLPNNECWYNWAKWDDDLLKVEIQELEDLEFDLKMTGFELEKIQRFLDDLDGEEERGEKSEKEISELIDTKSVVSKPGDLWILYQISLVIGQMKKSSLCL